MRPCWPFRTKRPRLRSSCCSRSLTRPPPPSCSMTGSAPGGPFRRAAARHRRNPLIDSHADPKGHGFLAGADAARDGPRTDGQGNSPLRKDKESVAKRGGLVKVRVSGKLRRRRGRGGQPDQERHLCRDRREQEYDPHTREWKSARWTVNINNELANGAGFTVTQARGQMVVESKAAIDSGPSTAANVDAKPRED